MGNGDDKEKIRSNYLKTFFSFQCFHSQVLRDLAKIVRLIKIGIFTILSKMLLGTIIYKKKQQSNGWWLFISWHIIAILTSALLSRHALKCAKCEFFLSRCPMWIMRSWILFALEPKFLNNRIILSCHIWAGSLNRDVTANTTTDADNHSRITTRHAKWNLPMILKWFSSSPRITQRINIKR